MATQVSVPEDYLFFLRTSLPNFWDMKMALKRIKTLKLLDEFYTYAVINERLSYSQLFQDIFVDFLFKQAEKKRFLEFGATNGVELSNTFMLEQVRGWTGVLAEPDPQWHKELKKNRPKAKVLLDCIYTKTGEKLKFISSVAGVLSSLKSHAQADANGPLRGNAEERMKAFREIEVVTISLNDVFEKYLNDEPIEYMSIDTEGSEYDILLAFNFEKYGPTVVTVEHNYTEAQSNIDNLFKKNGYVNIFSELTAFDAWYVKEEFARIRGLI